MRLRTTPSRDQQSVTQLPFPFRAPEAVLSPFISGSLLKWTDAFIPDAVERIRHISEVIKRDEQAVDRQPTSHRWSRLCHNPDLHVRISMEYYTAPVQAVLRAGYTIIFDDNERASLCMNSPRQAHDFGFHDEVITKKVRRIGWMDEELLHFLGY